MNIARTNAKINTRLEWLCKLNKISCHPLWVELSRWCLRIVATRVSEAGVCVGNCWIHLFRLIYVTFMSATLSFQLRKESFWRASTKDSRLCRDLACLRKWTREPRDYSCFRSLGACVSRVSHPEAQCEFKWSVNPFPSQVLAVLIGENRGRNSIYQTHAHSVIEPLCSARRTAPHKIMDIN